MDTEKYAKGDGEISWNIQVVESPCNARVAI